MNKQIQVVFYGNTLRAFRTTLIWYLYEVCQVYDCYLIISEIDSETRAFIQNQNIFPGLKRVFVQDCTNVYDWNLLTLNSRVFKLAKRLISEFKPQIIFCSSDWHSLFEMYLLRLAKRRNIDRITLQDTVTNNVLITRKIYHLIESANVQRNSILFQVLKTLKPIRRHLLHFVIYWICPVLNLEKPFFGKSSYILMTGQTGSRDTNLHVVFKENYKMFIDSGVPESKLLVNEHPITRINKEVLKSYFISTNNCRGKNRAVILLGDQEIGFDKKNLEQINKQKKIICRIKIIREIVSLLSDYSIIVKAHPNLKNLEHYKNSLNDLKDKIEFIPQKDSVEKYIIESNLIIDLPAPNSSAIYFATLFYPKIIICVDTLHEFLGDYYRDFSKVKYIDRMDDLSEYLLNIKSIWGKIRSDGEERNKTVNCLNIIEIYKYMKAVQDNVQLP